MSLLRHIHCALLCTLIFFVWCAQTANNVAPERGEFDLTEISFLQYAHESLDPEETQALIETTLSLTHLSREQKAKYLSNRLAVQAAQGISEDSLDDPQPFVGYDSHEGLAEPTPQCKRILNKWTKECVFSIHNLGDDREPRPPEPVDPGPGGSPGPSAPGPSAPGPSAPGPSAPGPSAPGPIAPGPSTPGPSAPGPSTPGPSAPGPSAPGPSTPGPSAPGPSAPGPSAPGPSTPGPSAPGPSAPPRPRPAFLLRS